MGVKRRMEELRVEVGGKESFKKLMTSRLKWAGHVERMGVENLAEIRCSLPRKWRKCEDAMGGLC